MAGIPPHLDTDTGTPSGDWAKSTTTAAFARSEPAPATSSDAPKERPPNPKQSVSGEVVPGAYPATADPPGGGPQMSVKDSAVHAAGVGYAYAASAASTAASYLPKGVVDTVSSYMPTSHATSTTTTAQASEHDVQHKTSLPTHEYTGAGPHEHTGGVGSLPGSLNETGVAKLPDENTTDQQPYLTIGAAVGAAGAGIGAGAYAAKEAIGGNPEPHDPGHGAHHHSTAVTSSTLPSHEPTGAHPGDHSMGVGELPGNQSEPHVARLPEESIHPQYDSGDIDTAAQVSMLPSEELHGNEAAKGDIRHVGGVGALVGDQSEVSVAKLPEERQHEHYHEVGPRGDPGAGMTGPTGVGGAVVVAPHEEPHDVPRREHYHEVGARGDPGAGMTGPIGVGGAVMAAHHEEGHGEHYHEVGPRGDPGAGMTGPIGMEGALVEREEPESATNGHHEHHKHHHHKHHHEAEGVAAAAGVGAAAAAGEHHEEKTGGPPPKEEGAATREAEGEREEQATQEAKHADKGKEPAAAAAAAAPEGGHHDQPHQGPGYQSDYHPAQMHPREETAGQPVSSQAAEGEKSPGATQVDTSRPAEQQAQTQTHRRASFMEKMKGEAKVLLGKIEGKQEKVAEGERMKHPETQAKTAPAEPQITAPAVEQQK